MSYRHVPNLLTAFRLVLAGVFFLLLSFYQYEGRGDPLLIQSAFVVYIVALVTDFLDGYLARRWDVGSAFGRVVDPFADKILVLGTFIFFAGKNFIIPDVSHAAAVAATAATTAITSPGPKMVVRTITGVAPWVVVLLLARELLVTSLRGMGEGAGQSFAAVWAGKFKMGFQSGTILYILLYVSMLRWLNAHGWDFPARCVLDFGIWGTVIITLYSGITYINRAVVMYRLGSVRL